MQRVRLPLTDRRIDHERLYHLRTSAGITQRAIAERAQISENWYRQVEHGTQHPSRPVAESIASALGVSLDDFSEPVIEQRDAA